MSSFISSSGLTYLWTKIKAWVNGQGFLTQHQDISGKADKSTTTTAGTYKSVTVNSSGIVTGGSNPTTLAGYGITDAASSSDLAGYLPLSGGTLTGALTVNSPMYAVGGSIFLDNNKAINIKDPNGTYRQAITISEAGNFNLGYGAWEAGGNTFIFGGSGLYIRIGSGTVDVRNALYIDSSKEVHLYNNLYLPNNKGVLINDSQGTAQNVIKLNDSNHTVIGYGNAVDISGNTSITGTASISSNLTVSGNLNIANNKYIKFRNAANTNDYVAMYLTSNNHLYIGYDVATNGCSTYVAGNTVELRYGTSRRTGLTLDASGNVSIAGSLSIGGNAVVSVYSGSSAPSSSLGSDGDIYIQT